MAVLYKHGRELARLEKTHVDENAKDYGYAEVKTILSFREDGWIMFRRVETCANGYKPNSPWRMYRKFKSSVDVEEAVASKVKSLKKSGWTVK